MKAFLNQRFLNQTRFDSAAPAGAAVVAHRCEREGEFELHVGLKRDVLARARFAVGSDPAAREAVTEAAPLPAVGVDLFKLVRPGVSAPALPAIAPGGWLSLTSSQPLRDHHVLLREQGVRSGSFDSRRLDGRSLFALTMIRPGRYSLADAISGAAGEIVVAYPVRGKRAYRPPEPLQIEVTEKGFGAAPILLSPAQGLVFRFAAESRIQIELLEPDDGPAA